MTKSENNIAVEVPQTPSAEETSRCRTAAPPTRVLIRPRTGWIAVDWRELWQFRELLYFLTWRDIKVKYKQTVLGAAWAILQPVIMTVVFTLTIGKMAAMEGRAELAGCAYAVCVYAALLPWNFFSTGVSMGGQSLVNQQQLLTKIYLPRLFVPMSSVCSGLVDMAISFCVFGVMLVIYQQAISWQVLLLVPLIVLNIVAALGISFALAALTVTYRDFRFVVPFMIQAMMFVSPVFYLTEMFDKEYHWLMALNPMTGIIDGYRAAILPTQPWNWTTLLISSLSAIVIFIFGVYYFRRTERRFADIA